MGFQEAFQLGKKYLRLPTGRKVPTRNQNLPSKRLHPGGFIVHPAGRLSSMAENSFLPMPKGGVGSPGAGKKGLPVAEPKERDTSLQEEGNRSAFPKTPADLKLLNSFPGHKNAELRECSRGSEVPKPDHGTEDPIALLFFLTRKLLSKTAEPLDSSLIQDDDRLERALGRIHSRLPFSVRLVMRKKRYIQFMLDNRERLVP